jgi:hypothetical protein
MLCASALKKGQARKARSMAADKPAKAPPLYEGGRDKSTVSPVGLDIQDFAIARSAATRQSMDCVASLAMTMEVNCEP